MADRSIIPIELAKDIDGCWYYRVAEKVEIKGHIIYHGNIIDGRDIKMLLVPPIKFNVSNDYNDDIHQRNFQAGINRKMKKLEDIPDGANALLLDNSDTCVKEHVGSWCRVIALQPSNLRRLCG
jgi:hypothetical protein